MTSILFQQKYLRADISDRPVFYRGRGRVKGSFVRVGDSDEPMTEYEVYSYEAYRKKYQDDIRVIERASLASLDQAMLAEYMGLLKKGKVTTWRQYQTTRFTS